ncbi:MAG: hypothetical protein QM774_04065 [Gordonia sp. (in: high G+C Gram-positive bacteria)]|uniref:YncE family protein n=1 Tax=Gordonia sp. (in: high G+C Gram-positive bacteria) TaxID=84139 RepID=UPI0039E4E17F
MRVRHKLLSVLSALLLSGVLAACGGGSGDDSDGAGKALPPATAAVSPRNTDTPAGTVVPAPSATGLAVAGDRIAFAGDDGALHLATVAAPGSATPTEVRDVKALAADGDGFLVVTPNAIIRVAADGTHQDTAVQGRSELDSALSVARDGDRVLVGTRTGHVLVFGADGHLQRDIGGFDRVDDLLVGPPTAALPGQVVVLDRAQSLVEPIDVESGEHKASLRAGNGAGGAVIDHFGRISVANTRDGEVLGFFGQPIVMRFRAPAGASPYAVAYDEKRDLLWVSTTGDNIATAYDPSTGEPRERGRVPTVGQVSAMAVAGDGTLLLLSGRGDGLQVVPPAVQNLR